MNRFESYFPQQRNLTGTLLVASPGLSNTPMAEAVVLVVQDAESGVFGARINSIASSQQATAFEKASHLMSPRESLMIGGPLSGPVMALHQNQDLAELKVHDGVFVSCSQNALQGLVDGEGEDPSEYDFEFPSANDYRIVLGIAGWNTSQIHAEIEAGLWFPVDGDPDIVFEDPETMWYNAFRRYGDNVMFDVTGVSPAGVDCELN